MESIAIFVSICAALFTAILLTFFPSGNNATQDKAQARRSADAKMNARLLRFDI